MTKSLCPTNAELAAHLRGETSVAIESHLSECEACLKKFDRLMEEEHGTMMAQIRQDGPIALIEDKEPVPDRIGVYKIIRKIGQGGMGVVYEAVHTELERCVAIKLVRSADPHFLDRFQREKKIAGLFQHPNIVEATDAGMFNGKPYLVSEFLSGSDLQDLIKKDGLLPWQRAVGIIAQAAKGLDHLHRKGVIHRDIKPSNIFLTDDGVVKILDLGLARQASQSEDATKHTMTGHVVGSPDFMAPEQFRGAAVDARSDIYSLGCTLSYIMTGKSLSESQADLPETVRILVGKMTAGMPDQRFQSAKELVEAIDSLSTVGQTSKAKRMWAVAGIVLISCIVAILSLSRDGNKVEQYDEIAPIIDTNPIEQEIDSENSSPIDELNGKFEETFRKDEPRLRREAAAYQKAMDKYKQESISYTNAMYEWKKKNTGEYPLPPPAKPDPPEFMRKHLDAQEELYKKTPEYQAYLKEKDEWEKEAAEHEKQYDAWERDPDNHPRPSPLRPKPFPPVRPVPPPSPTMRSVPPSMPS